MYPYWKFLCFWASRFPGCDSWVPTIQAAEKSPGRLFGWPMTSDPIDSHNSGSPFNWLVSMGKITGQSHDLHGKIDGFRLRFSLKSTHWLRDVCRLSPCWCRGWGYKAPPARRPKDPCLARIPCSERAPSHILYMVYRYVYIYIYHNITYIYVYIYI